MPNTRPGMKFNDECICSACINYEKRKTINWDSRWEELKKICDKHRGSNGDGYDCAIAVSGGKDSHYIVYLIKEKLKMNPVLLSSGNIDWTEIGRENLQNLSDTFSCDIIMNIPNYNVARTLAKKSFIEIGTPTWYIDALMYAFPFKMAIKLGTKLLFHGEDINFTYGGKNDYEKASGLDLHDNDVVKPLWDQWLEKNEVTRQELSSTRPPSLEECKVAGLEPLYMSYFVPWDSHHNYEVVKKYGFRHLEHEHKREGTIENYNQIDSLGYLLNQFLKYPKFGHGSVTEMASRWIRENRVTRDEMIPLVKQKDKILDQEIVKKFCDFTRMSYKEFFQILDKWYNSELFEQDKDGVWHEKFEVGVGLK
jgi:N-acetyl sugar amidotransferase